MIFAETTIPLLGKREGLVPNGLPGQRSFSLLDSRPLANQGSRPIWLS
jgi:hypothetical protein